MPRGCPVPPLGRSPTSHLTPLLIVLLLMASLVPLGQGGHALATDNTLDQSTPHAFAAPMDTLQGVSPARQAENDDLAPLRTVGGASPRITGESEQDIRSQSGSLLAGSDSAWRDLSRAERAILLDSDAIWASYDEAVDGDIDRDDLLFPVIELVWDVSEGVGVTDETLLINTVILDLPADKLGPALEESERQAIVVGPAVILLFDNVVVARINLTPDTVWADELDQGDIDDRGLIVAPGAASSSRSTADPTSTAPTTTPGTTSAAAPTREPKYSASGEEIPTVTLDELPIEAAETIYLILSGGPFPFDRDGVTFGNYEGHLPDAEFGYYREYTVITPGVDHRGARRIVTGDNDAVFYYTDDHYESFAEVILPNE